MSGLLAAGVAITALTLPARAQVKTIDMVVVGRALSFVDNLRHHSPVRLGIVYDPQNAQSAQQAQAVDAMLRSGLRIGSLTFEPVMVPIAALNKSRVEAFFLTDGLGPTAAAVGQATRARKMPCITFDLSEVRNGACAMGIRTHPRVDVFVNRAAAAASGLELAAVFRILTVDI